MFVKRSNFNVINSLDGSGLYGTWTRESPLWQSGILTNWTNRPKMESLTRITLLTNMRKIHFFQEFFHKNYKLW